MRVRVSQDDLADAAGWIAKTVNVGRAHLPALSGVRLNAAFDGLELAATDTNTTAVVTIPAAVEDDGMALAPAQLLAAIAKVLPDGSVTLATADDNLDVEAPGASFGLRMLPLEDWPALPDAIDSDGVAIPGALFSGLIGQVAAAVDVTNTREILRGVNLAAVGDRLRMAAIGEGGHRAIVRYLPWRGGEFSATVPWNVLADVRRRGGDVTVRHDGNAVAFDFGDRTVRSQVLQGDYPPLWQAIPDSLDTRAEVKSADLLAAVERCITVVAPNSIGARVLVVRLGDGEIAVRGTAAQVGKASTSIPADVTGPAVEFACNGTFLDATVKACDADAVALDVAPDRPIVVRAADSLDLPHTACVMPIRL